MKDVSPQSIETTAIDVEAMVKRIFKVAELLAHHTAQTQDLGTENRFENRDCREMEYGVAEDQQTCD